MSFRHIGCDALCYVVLDVVVEDGVIVLMITLRSGEVYHIIGCGFGVRHDGAAGETHLRVHSVTVIPFIFLKATLNVL